MYYTQYSKWTKYNLRMVTGLYQISVELRDYFTITQLINNKYKNKYKIIVIKIAQMTMSSIVALRRTYFYSCKNITTQNFGVMATNR